MQTRPLLQIGLRATFALLTLLCVVAAYYSRELRGDQFVHAPTYSVDGNVPIEVARKLRDQIDALPQHQGDSNVLFDFSRRFNVRAFEGMKLVGVSDRFFYRVRLSDDSETLVGVWIYPRIESNRTIGTNVTIVTLARDSFFDIRSGNSRRRELERMDLLNQCYAPIIRQIETHK